MVSRSPPYSISKKIIEPTIGTLVKVYYRKTYIGKAASPEIHPEGQKAKPQK